MAKGLLIAVDADELIPGIDAETLAPADPPGAMTSLATPSHGCSLPHIGCNGPGGELGAYTSPPTGRGSQSDEVAGHAR